MTLDVTTGALVDAAGGLLMAVLGAVVASLRPRRAANVAFGVFAIAFGSAFVVANIFVSPGADPRFAEAGFLGFALLATVAVVALIVLARRSPRPLHRSERRLQVLPAVAGAAHFAAVAAVRLIWPETTSIGFLRQVLPVSYGPGMTSTALLLSSLTFALFLLAQRFRAARPEEERVRRETALVSAALLLYWGFVAGAGFNIAMSVLSEFPGDRATAAFHLFLVLGLAALWLRNAAAGRSASLARNVALLAPATAFVGLAYTAFVGTWGGHGLARAGCVVFLAYAMLRHHLFGIDVKVKWTLRQSTVAAIFVAVFFIVSETAQQVFSSTRLGPYFGIAAAGMLAFAIHPLQHFAQRVADRAMPGVKAPETMTQDERARAYLEAARQAWADGSMTQDERAMLDRMRAALGLAEDEAHRLEGEAARGAPVVSTT